MEEYLSLKCVFMYFEILFVKPVHFLQKNLSTLGCVRQSQCNFFMVAAKMDVSDVGGLSFWERNGSIMLPGDINLRWEDYRDIVQVRKLHSLGHK